MIYAEVCYGRMLGTLAKLYPPQHNASGELQSLEVFATGSNGNFKTLSFVSK
jgi:hypothetical protein